MPILVDSSATFYPCLLFIIPSISLPWIRHSILMSSRSSSNMFHSCQTMAFSQLSVEDHITLWQVCRQFQCPEMQHDIYRSFPQTSRSTEDAWRVFMLAADHRDASLAHQMMLSFHTFAAHQSNVSTASPSNCPAFSFGNLTANDISQACLASYDPPGSAGADGWTGEHRDELCRPELGYNSIYFLARPSGGRPPHEPQTTIMSIFVPVDTV